MNKDSIYKIIGYNGEYNNSVKKAIRKLLKENHPDNNGDRRIFELINEVKEELENNRVSYNYKKNNGSTQIDDDIDYLYCSKMVDQITKEKAIYEKSLNNKNEKLKKYIDEYKVNYRNNIDLESSLLSNNDLMNKLKNTKVLCIILLILAILTFIISVWKESILFLAIFTLLTIICVLTIQKTFYLIRKMTDVNKNKIKNYVTMNSSLRNNLRKQEELKQEINDINKIINNYENDLRFYDNILKNRGQG